MVGELQARVLVDRFARVLTADETDLLDQMVAPGTRADVQLDLYGARYLLHLLGVKFGVARLDVAMEQVGAHGASAVITGRTEAGDTISRTGLSLVEGADGWMIDDIRVLGVGPEDRLYGPIWERLTNARPLPFRDFDALPDSEQELTSGLLDEGCRLDEIAAAVLLLRDSELGGDAGTLAAAAHAAFEYACGRPCAIHPLCDRYACDAVDVAMLLERMTTRLDLTPEDTRYAVPE